MAYDIDSLQIEVSADSTAAAKNVRDLADALNELRKSAQDGAGLGNVSSKLKKMAEDSGGSQSAQTQKALKENQKLAQSNEKLSKSYERLGGGISSVKVKFAAYAVAAKRVAQAMSGWITESNAYVENLNLFTVAMGEYADSAQEYAEQVSEIMGIDPSVWMRNQGVFMTLATGFGVTADKAALMSQNLTQLGYDLASFFNLKVEDAMQKLQSGISGELEPLRRLGYDLSQAKLQQIAYANGIKETVSSMTQAEKAQLRYVAIMTQVTTAQGDMARTLESPANQLRILQASITQAARALGNVLIPVLNKVLPYLIAFVNIVADAAQALASFLGFELPEVDYSGVNGLASSGESAENALAGAAKAAKELKNATLGIDELNVISPNTGVGAGTSAGGAGFDLDLPDYDFIGDAITSKAKEIEKKLKPYLEPILKMAKDIGVAFAGWKIASGLVSAIQSISTSLAAGKGALGAWSGLTTVIGGTIVAEVGLKWAWESGYNIGTGTADFKDFVKGGIGAMAASVGGAVIGGVLGGGAGAAAGFVIGLGVSLLVGFAGIMQGSFDNTLLVEEFWASAAGQRLKEIQADIEERAEIRAQITANMEIRAGNITAVESDFAAAYGMISSLYELVEKDEKTVEDLELIQGYISQINGLKLDGIQLEYNGLTNEINMSKDAVYALIEAQKLQAVADQYMENIKGTFVDLAAAQDAARESGKQYAEVLGKVEQYEKNIQWINEQRNAYGPSATLSEEESARLTKLVDMQAKYQTALNDTLPTLEAAKEDYAANKEVLAGLQSELEKAEEKYASIAISMGKSVDSLGGFNGKASGASGAVSTAAGEIDRTTSGLAEDINGNWSKVKELELEVKDNVTSETRNVVDDVNNNILTNVDEVALEVKAGLPEKVAGIISKINTDVLPNIKKAAIEIGGDPVGAVKDIVSKINKALTDIKPISIDVGASLESTGDVKTYATGGYPDAGQMFIAREQGPELVGRIGNRTAVANNDQIVEGVSAGVYEAVSAAMSQSGGQSVEVAVYLDGRQINAAVKKTQKQSGVSIGTGGLVYG